MTGANPENVSAVSPGDNPSARPSSFAIFTLMGFSGLDFRIDDFLQPAPRQINLPRRAWPHSGVR